MEQPLGDVIRETGREVFAVSSGLKMDDKETRWWNREVQESIQRKTLRTKGDDERTDELTGIQ